MSNRDKLLAVKSRLIEAVGMIDSLLQENTPAKNVINLTPAAGAPRINPVAQSLGELITAKQLGMIKAIGREANIDVEVECNRLFMCMTSELSKRAASEFIDSLNRLRSPRQ